MQTVNRFFIVVALILGITSFGPLATKSHAQYDGSTRYTGPYTTYPSAYTPYAVYYPSAYVYTTYPATTYDAYALYTTIYATAYYPVTTYYSDARLKKNITPVAQSLKKVNELGGYTYLWKDASKDQSLQTGLLAQEVERLFPELVKKDPAGTLMVNYIGLIPHLVESIKQLTTENSQLKSQNVASADQNLVILRKLEALEAKMNVNSGSAEKQEIKTK